MPNTLAHTGLHALITRAFISPSDLKWVYLGLVIPDIPWIIQRIVRFAGVSVDPFLLRAYVSVQATLLGCLVLSAAAALLSRRCAKIFVLLAGNCVLHLVFDALQIKWANGVHFLAPFSWKLTSWGLFWPESWVAYLATLTGLILLVRYWRASVRVTSSLPHFDLYRLAAVGSLVLLYFLLPLLLLDNPVRANNYYLNTLRSSEARTGSYFECDRGSLSIQSGKRFLECVGSQPFTVKGAENVDPPATVSVRGTFVSRNALMVSEIHIHDDWFRTYASCLGLVLIAGVWIAAGVQRYYGWVRLGT